jgi:ankyrin repeat protein
LYAVKQGNDSIVRLLLEHGADVNAEMLDIPEDELSLKLRAEENQILHRLM